jgi:hypothetical protein
MRRAILACRAPALSIALVKNVQHEIGIRLKRAGARYWHQPSVGLLSQDTAQLPALLQADSSALRTDCFQSQSAQPGRNSSRETDRTSLMTCDYSAAREHRHPSAAEARKALQEGG